MTKQEIKQQLETLREKLDDIKFFLDSNGKYLTPSQLKANHAYQSELQEAHNKYFKMLQDLRPTYITRKRTGEQANYIYVLGSTESNGFAIALPIMTYKTHKAITGKRQTQLSFSCKVNTLQEVSI